MIPSFDLKEGLEAPLAVGSQMHTGGVDAGFLNP